MQNKNFNHKEIEQCRISKKPIDTTKERYSILVECEGRKINSIGFYKGQLLLDLIKGNLNSISQELMNKHKKIAGSMLQRLNAVMRGN